jgi:hypothetical protein
MFARWPSLGVLVCARSRSGSALIPARCQRISRPFGSRGRRRFKTPCQCALRRSAEAALGVRAQAQEGKTKAGTGNLEAHPDQPCGRGNPPLIVDYPGSMPLDLIS